MLNLWSQRYPTRLMPVTENREREVKPILLLAGPRLPAITCYRSNNSPDRDMISSGHRIAEILSVRCYEADGTRSPVPYLANAKIFPDDWPQRLTRWLTRLE